MGKGAREKTLRFQDKTIFLGDWKKAIGRFDEHARRIFLHGRNLHPHPTGTQVADQLDVVGIAGEDDDGIDLFGNLGGGDRQGTTVP